MTKSADIVQLRMELRAKFRQEYGPVTAFCRERGISPEWLRLVFAGRYEGYDLLVEAAEFLSRYKEENRLNGCKTALFCRKGSQFAALIQTI
ncbi:MAG: hypothetical protein IPM81_17405 [Saprospirales bacterium]|nr:hypothetical protein [Saprospirales bacterium]